MQDIIDLAERLGRTIAQSPQSVHLREARTAMEKEGDLVKTLNDYHAQADKIAQLEQTQKPVEVEDKRRLQDLHDRLVGSATFKKFMAAQVEYLDMMRKVNETLRKQLGDVEGPEGQ
jgi:cell fate (sporulation/competence/biofilm development) regulator YlbF (YheA/YmcA/DUF963 family)